MPFNKKKYQDEMKKMIDKAIDRIKTENPKIKIYSVSIWTDPNSRRSAINFESKANSDKKVMEANKYMAKTYKSLIASGEKELASQVTNKVKRNCNPADFRFRNYEVITHSYFPTNWEEMSNGKCWQRLSPELDYVGIYALQKIKLLNLEDDFELAINSREDWYDKTWKLK